MRKVNYVVLILRIDVSVTMRRQTDDVCPRGAWSGYKTHVYTDQMACSITTNIIQKATGRRNGRKQRHIYLPRDLRLAFGSEKASNWNHADVEVYQL